MDKLEISLTQEQRVENALAFLSKYHSCCTAVFATYATELGIQEEFSAQLTQAMPGIGASGNVCGAVSGAALVLSLIKTNVNDFDDSESQQQAYATIRKFISQFEARYASTQCKDILGHDISSPEKYEQAREKGLFTLCPKVVKDAVIILDEMLKTETRIA